jgi:hypothetical protein
MNAISTSKKNPAIGLVILMLSSLLLAGVVAEVNDGNGTTGIDRNPNPGEYDGSKITQTYDATTTHSKQMVQFTGNMKGAIVDAGSGQGNNIAYSDISGGWTVAGDQLSAEFNTDRANVSFGAGENTPITMRNTADGASSQEVQMTMKNWYATIDRSSAHTFATPAQNSKADGCEAIGGQPEISNLMMCSLNADGGLSADLPTQMISKPSISSPIYSWGLLGSNDTRNLYFGVDYETSYNMGVYVNGVEQTIGGSIAVIPTDTVELRCSATDCTEDNVIIGIPGAYNASGTNFDPLVGLSHTASDEVLNSTARLGIFSSKILKLTFGLADSNNDGTIDDEANVSAADGQILYDPAISFDVAEPGVRIGQIEDGGASWCDAKWFLAKCSDMTLDGNSSDGVDGMFMQVNIPMEHMFQVASWGGFDEAILNLEHESEAACFNGDIRSYILTESQWDSSFSKNNLLTYAVSGDYYTVSEPTVGLNEAKTYGSTSADYCMGTGNSVSQTPVELDRVAQMTQNSMMYEYSQGFYDFDDEIYSFYVVLSVSESTAGAVGNSNTIRFNAEETEVVLTHTNNYNPLETSSLATVGDVSRTTNTTGQSNPAHASPYVNYYSGITPSDNVIAGRNLSGTMGGVADDFGPMYMGTQTASNQVRKASEYYVENYSTEVLSTIECGLATTGLVTSAQIEIFTNTDTSARMGAGQNGSGVSVETEWKEYGVRTDNSSVWTMGAASTYATTPSNWNYTPATVDNDEVNANSNSVSFTGVFINGDTYKAKCTLVYNSMDVGAGNYTTTTVTYEQVFTATYDGNYVGSGGSDVSEDDDSSWIEDLSGWDLIIIALAIAIIGLGIYMWAVGPKWEGWFDDRTAMILFGVGLLHAWFAHNFSPETGFELDWVSEDTSMIIGTLGYLVMTAAVYLYGAGTTSMSERNFRYALGGLFLIIIGIPTTLGGLLGIESELLEEAMWTFPIYELISAVGSFVGILLLSASAVSIFRREGM